MKYKASASALLIAVTSLTACASGSRTTAPPPAQLSHVIGKHVCGTRSHPLYCMTITAPPDGASLIYVPKHLYKEAQPGDVFNPVNDTVSK